MLKFLKVIFIFCSLSSFGSSTEGLWSRVDSLFKGYNPKLNLKKADCKNFSSEEFRDLAKDIAERVNTSEADVWINPERKLNGPLEKTFSKAEGESKNWTPLTPGDIIYYEGATGKCEFKHTAFYLGLGCTLELWNIDGKGVVVLSKLEYFKTSATEISYLFCGKCRKKKKYSVIKKISDSEILNFYKVKVSKKRPVILEEAADSIVGFENSEDYSVKSNNCQSFICNILTGEKTYNYQLERFVYSIGNMLKVSGSLFLIYSVF
jgi:hypothetical protein